MDVTTRGLEVTGNSSEATRKAAEVSGNAIKFTEKAIDATGRGQEAMERGHEAPNSQSNALINTRGMEPVEGTIAKQEFKR